MRSFTIVPATDSDIPEILAMIRELAEFEHLAHEVKATPERMRAALCGDQRVAWALMARVGATAAGYAIYFRTYSTFVGLPGVYLEDIYVRPQFRRAGIARAMIEEVAKASVALGGGRLEWMALNWNENALKFYRGLGARVMDDWVLLRMTGDEAANLAAAR